MPEEETTPMGHIFDTADILKPTSECPDSKVTIFTDGSGGKRAKDKRLRRCGWAWVVPRPGIDKDVRYGARGAVGELQTVPGAEFRAIHHCLSSFKEHPHIKELVIYSDCKMAVGGIAKGRQHTSKTKLGQLWACVWDEYEACLRNGMQIIVHREKPHEKDIDKVPQILQDGNNCADHHAGLAVIECPNGEENRIRSIDSKARWFQERMIQALLLLPKRGRHPNEQHQISEVVQTRQPHITQRVARAKILKHEVFRRGPMLECLRCGQFWESTASSLIYSEGVCPGPKLYGPPQKERPWVIPANSGPIWWGRSKLHKSHRASWYKGCAVLPKLRAFFLERAITQGIKQKMSSKPWEQILPNDDETHQAWHK